MRGSGASLFCLLLVLCLWSPAPACLNDRDTLAEEVRGLPDAVQIITGRFERNPPLFYQMRVARIAAELKTDPARLNDYDDIAVASDRLGQDDDALYWMARKRAELVRQAVPPHSEDWYRYFANDGTARVHRWLRAGADRTRIAEVVKARDEIANALRIKPDAHFGREKYQLLVMNWIVESGETRSSSRAASGANLAPLGKYILSQARNRDETQRGLLGLIALGGAWESVDIFQALSYAFRRPWQGNLSLLAAHRCAELLDQGQQSLAPWLSVDDVRDSLRMSDSKSIFGGMAQANKDYASLRAEAQNWQAKRTAYMMARLTQGRHPDTDATFWAGWHDPGPSPLAVPLERQATLALRRMFGYQGAEFVTGCLILTPPVFALAILFKVMRRRLSVPKGRHEDFRLTRR